MNRLQAISKRILSANISKRIIAASVKLGMFLFFFVTANAASALDVIAKLLGKALQDNASASDTASKAVVKAPTDAAASSDADTKLFGKSLQDNPSATDSQNKDVSKASTDSALGVDADAKLFGKPLENTSSAIDAPIKTFTKAPTDAATGSDNNAKTVGKNVSDQLFSTDDINGAGADDDQNISFFKVLSNPAFVVENIVLLAAFLRSFSNTSTATDAPALLTGKPFADSSETSDTDVKLTGLVKSDTISTGSAGTLLNQDYVDNPDYFADDYVGVKRTF